MQDIKNLRLDSVPTATLLREKNDLEQLCQSDPAKTRSFPKTQGHSRVSVRDGFKKKYSTSTVCGQQYLVPWLASEGPLAYTPEEPPAKDYFFQYSWILPKIFDPEENLRNHFYFGIRYKHGAKFLFQFWERARKGYAQQNVCKLGLLATKEVKAPIAAYHHVLEPGSKWGSLLIQHGSYQWIDLQSQPHIERGQVLLYRGIERASAFRYLWLEPEKLSPFNLEIWRKYLTLQAQMLSDSVLSFNTIHDRTKRAETSHLRDGTWLSDELARRIGLDIDSPGFVRNLWAATHQSYSLETQIRSSLRGVGNPLIQYSHHYVFCR